MSASRLRARRIVALCIGLGLVTLLQGCAANPELSLQLKIERAIAASGHASEVRADGYVGGANYRSFVILRSTVAELGGPVQAGTTAQVLAMAIFARVPDVQSISFTDANGADIGTFRRPAGT